MKKKGKILLLAVIAAVVIAIGAPLAAMIAGASGAPAAEPGAVVLLGFRLEEDGKPNQVLLNRCEAAAVYLQAHPGVLCVATGGGDPSEAEVMRDVLVGMGIDEARILLEPRAANTGENLACSAALLKERGVTGPVVIVTDAFHQYRAAYFARRNGLTATPLNCETSPLTAFTYGCREILAIYKAWVFRV